MKGEGSPRPRRYDDLLVIGGCPRSGTTFAQLLLHATGMVATANETHLFSQIVGPAIRRYRGFALQRTEGRRDVGPHVVLEQDAYLDVFRSLVDQAIDAMRGQNRAVAFVCEKTPENILFWPEIAELLPGVRFIEMVRDPRAVFASTRAAADRWAGSWATVAPGQFAKRWLQFVRCGSALAATPLPSVRIQYEKLVSTEVDYLQSVLGEIGLPLATDAALQARNATRIRTIKKTPSAGAPWSLSTEPTGFFRKGEVDSWRKELSGEDIAEIEAEVGDDMRALGYRPNARAQPPQDG